MKKSEKAKDHLLSILRRHIPSQMWTGVDRALSEIIKLARIEGKFQAVEELEDLVKKREENAP